MLCSLSLSARDVTALASARLSANNDDDADFPAINLLKCEHSDAVLRIFDQTMDFHHRWKHWRGSGCGWRIVEIYIYISFRRETKIHVRYARLGNFANANASRLLALALCGCGEDEVRENVNRSRGVGCRPSSV